MARPAEFLIPVKGLSDGAHRFEMSIDDGFFASIPASLVRGGRLKAVVEALKGPALLSLGVGIAGEVQVECDRCLEPLTLAVDYRGEASVKTGEGEDDGEVLWVAPGEEELDLRQYLYESICLSLPLSRVHEDPAQCNPQMLARITREG